MNHLTFLFLILTSPLSWGQVVSNSGGGSFSQKEDCLLITNGFSWKNGIIAMTRTPQNTSNDGFICSIDLNNHPFFLFNKDNLEPFSMEQDYLFDMSDNPYLETTIQGYTSSSHSYFLYVDVDFLKTSSGKVMNDYPQWIILFPVDNDNDFYRWNRFIEDFEEKSAWREMTLHYIPSADR